MKRHCECADPACPVCKGRHNTDRGELPTERVTRYYRTDQYDLYGVDLCVSCGRDAMESGVFAQERRR